jgi:hypothetical protein
VVRYKKVNPANLKQDLSETDLTAALDKSVEAAVALHISETELVNLLIQHCHHEAAGDIGALHDEPHRKLFDPLAGP